MDGLLAIVHWISIMVVVLGVIELKVLVVIIVVVAVVVFRGRAGCRSSAPLAWTSTSP